MVGKEIIRMMLVRFYLEYSKCVWVVISEIICIVYVLECDSECWCVIGFVVLFVSCFMVLGKVIFIIINIDFCLDLISLIFLSFNCRIYNWLYIWVKKR